MSGIVIAVLIIAAIGVVVGLVYALYDGADITRADVTGVIGVVFSFVIAGGVIYGIGCGIGWLADLVGHKVFLIPLVTLPAMLLVI